MNMFQQKPIAAIDTRIRETVFLVAVGEQRSFEW